MSFHETHPPCGRSALAGQATTTQCVKVASLRKVGYESLKEWLGDPNNVYVGRRGRIFIDKVIFHYPGSAYANPFPLSNHTLEESLELYKTHLEESGLDPSKLRGKVLGCFCAQERFPDGSPKCHAQILADLADIDR